MNVGDFIKNRNKQVIFCRAEDSIQTAANLLSSNRIGAMPVKDENAKLIGMISERDIVRAFAEHSSALATKQVADFMTKQIISCVATDTIPSAMETMTHKRIRHLPVYEGQVFLGVISIGDTLAIRLQDLRTERNVLKDLSIASRSY